MDSIRKQNDISAGNVLDAMPVEVEKTEVPVLDVENLSTAHPRLLIQKRDLTSFRSEVKADARYCKFDNFLSLSVKPYRDKTPINEPVAYPEETVGKASLWRPYWRQMYTECQQAFNATRNLSLAGVILEDQSMIAEAKAWLLKITSFEPKGVTSRSYNDEAAFRVIASLAWGYDWLYEYLSEEEIQQVREVLIMRLEEIMHYLHDEVDLLSHPLNSHGVRCISSAIVPACIALYGDYAKAEEYLEYSLQYYALHYPPWGGRDGGWAEGPDYWNTAMAFLGEAFDLIKSYTTINLFNKEFYGNTGGFILYCMPVHSKRASFCDQSSLGDYPGLKLGYNMRHFAGVNQKPEYMWYFNQLKERDTEADSKFYNYGWWDFRYDDLRYEYLWKSMPQQEPDNGPLLKVFPETGWAAFHNRMTERSEHIHLIYKCSPFGSISHSHGDQNAFTLHAFGETLASITGYYVGFGVDMHVKWRRRTHSKNLVLFGGKGQYAENKSSGFKDHQDRYCVEAGGYISDYDSEASIPYIEGDATASYQFFNDDLISYRRKIWFIKGSVFLIRDRAELKSEQELTWLLHTTYETETGDHSFRIMGEKARLQVEFLHPGKEGLLSLESVEGFGDVDPQEYKNLEIHRHVEARFKEAKAHEILTLLVPSKRNEEETEPSYELKGKKLHLRLNGEEIIIDLELEKPEV